MPRALLTGAGQGIGRATARRLSSAGYDLVCVEFDERAARATASELGAMACCCDVADRSSVQQLARTSGPVEVLVNKAGIFRQGSLGEITEQDAAAVLGVNLLGTLWCIQAFAPAMAAAGGGAIVNLSSAAAATHAPGIGIYPSTKAAVEALTRQLALELGPAPIRVNAFAPGLVLTEGTAASCAGAEGEPRSRHVPLRRVGAPDDIAEVIAFLASSAARYGTGQVLYADGGATAGMSGS